MLSEEKIYDMWIEEIEERDICRSKAQGYIAFARTVEVAVLEEAAEEAEREAQKHDTASSLAQAWKRLFIPWLRARAKAVRK